MSLETKCENLMNIVVESRKRFGKMCVDYEQKTSLMENKILNLQIETFSNYKFKPKNTLPEVLDDDSKDLKDFSVTKTMEIVDIARRYDELRKKLKCTQEVVAQLKADSVGRRLQEPLTCDALLAKAKEKHLA